MIPINFDVISRILVQLDKKKIISYQERKSDPWIRVNKEIPKDYYPHSILPMYEVHEEKFSAMVDYMKGDKCRMSMIQVYFGETPQHDCQLCDNCKKRSRSGNNLKLFTALFNQLDPGNSMDLRMVLKDYNQAEKKDIISTLAILENEGIVCIKDWKLTLLQPFTISI